MKLNANEETYEAIELFGNTNLFSNFRIDKNTVPDNLYVYELRHDDECNGDIVEISEHILVNFMGTIICKDQIELTDKSLTGLNCRPVKLEDYGFLGYSLSLEEYINNKQAIRFFD